MYSFRRTPTHERHSSDIGARRTVNGLTRKPSLVHAPASCLLHPAPHRRQSTSARVYHVYTRVNPTWYCVLPPSVCLCRLRLSAHALLGSPSTSRSLTISSLAHAPSPVMPMHMPRSGPFGSAHINAMRPCGLQGGGASDRRQRLRAAASETHTPPHLSAAAMSAA